MFGRAGLFQLGTPLKNDYDLAICIRKASVDDAKKLIRAFKDSEKHIAPWVFPPSSIQEFVSREGLLLVESSGNDEILGYFNLSNIIRGPLQQAFLGFSAFHPHIKKGYMSKAMPLVLTYAFDELTLHRIEANIQPENLRSLSFVAKNGFQKEGFSKRYLNINGQWKDHERWAITKEDWTTSR